jgi:hypothetical protein
MRRLVTAHNPDERVQDAGKEVGMIACTTLCQGLQRCKMAWPGNISKQDSSRQQNAVLFMSQQQ